ncbi:MAG: hypothetical protein P4L66_01800 [Acetobacteraceae bacterium]|nr:hypothetical protein [Acetobacteraceae bacterium]
MIDNLVILFSAAMVVYVVLHAVMLDKKDKMNKRKPPKFTAAP